MVAQNGPIIIRQFGASKIRIASMSNGSVNINAGTSDTSAGGGIRLSCTNHLTLAPGGNLYIKDPVAGNNRAGKTGYIVVNAGTTNPRYLTFANGILVNVTKSAPSGYTNLGA
jgi:hypothetical protein